jgi:hypothetical protein
VLDVEDGQCGGDDDADLPGRLTLRRACAGGLEQRISAFAIAGVALWVFWPSAS